MANLNTSTAKPLELLEFPLAHLARRNTITADKTLMLLLKSAQGFGAYKPLPVSHFHQPRVTRRRSPVRAGSNTLWPDPT
jgi:hypothetical protein